MGYTITIMTARVKCPDCDSWNPAVPIEVSGRVSRRTSDSHNFVDAFYPVVYPFHPSIAVVQCGGCDSKFVALIYGSSRAESVWPLANVNPPDGLPQTVKEAYQDARLALAAKSRIGALLAGRAALERMLGEKGASNFENLMEKNIITPALYGMADQVRLWGILAAHTDVPFGNVKN